MQADNNYEYFGLQYITAVNKRIISKVNVFRKKFLINVKRILLLNTPACHGVFSSDTCGLISCGAFMTFIWCRLDFKWDFKLPALENDLLHCSHLCCFCPEWTTKWFFRWWTRLNEFSHCGHGWGFSIVCILMWTSRSWVLTLEELQIVHLCCFSPAAWNFKCRFSWPSWLNDFLHSSQLNGFSPVWVIKWMSRGCFLVLEYLQMVHLYDFSPPVWTSMWDFRFV